MLASTRPGDLAAASSSSPSPPAAEAAAVAKEVEESNSSQQQQRRLDEVRMVLDRLLDGNSGTPSSSSSSSPCSASSSCSATAAAAATAFCQYQQQQQQDGETTDSSSSLSSHSSTLKGTIREQKQRLAEDSRAARLELLDGQGCPTPPSPTTGREGPLLLDGISPEDTLRKMSGAGTGNIAGTKTITSRTPRDFFFIRVLGEGSFSTVYYAKEVDTGDEYAIKVLPKSDIRKEGRVRYVLREKDIMAALTYAYGGHPFVLRLYCTFQDNDRLYFALANAKHGELLDWLRRLGSFDETGTLFYASEILCALEFLHRCRVIHRDLKPENILVGVDWHIMISDFGTAKILEEESAADQEVDCQPNPPPIEPLPPGEVPGLVPSVAVKPTKRSVRSSFVGTAHYISPEVLKSEDVGPECDYWALGAIVFQMISGQPPFRAVNEYKIMKKILNLDFHFPDGFPEVAKDLVSRLLVYRPDERLGSAQSGGIGALKRHPFFRDVDWNNIFTRQPPELKPYLPASCGEPAFYGDYPLAGDIEPGLNEAAISRLLGLGMGTAAGGQSTGGSGSSFTEFKFRDEEEKADHRQVSVPSSLSTPADSNVPVPSATDELERIRLARLDKQRREHKFHRFVQDNLILKAGLIDKKKGLFARRRMFLLTDGPHLFYVDPATMHLKGEVPFSAQMRTEAKNFRTFFVHTPKRTYYLFDPERHAKDWCDAIDWVRERYFGGNRQQQQDERRQQPTTPTPQRTEPPNNEQSSRQKSNKTVQQQPKLAVADGSRTPAGGSRPGSGRSKAARAVKS